ncbi:phosphoenolpyruvate mutase [Mycoplasmatota bacterium WC30]
MKKVYLAMSADIIHEGHIKIINEAKKYGEVIIGLLTDDVISTYKRFPLLDFMQRKMIISNINGIKDVVEQSTLDYTENLMLIKPDFVIHGDDWKVGPQKPIRDKVIKVLESIGGDLIEIPYTTGISISALEQALQELGITPQVRRAKLKRLINSKDFVTIIEAHNGLTGLIAEKTYVEKDGKKVSFDGMWISSLCDSTAKGKPDIELVDLTSRLNTINEVIEVTTKPIILDGDTGGKVEHFVYTVRTLERLGVSAVIIEDKVGLKKNSLFGTSAKQKQDTIENFQHKIREGKKALVTKDFMIISRIESLILKQGQADALKRAHAYIEAGADAIMIHSKEKDSKEITDFLDEFRKVNNITPIVVVPSSYNTITNQELSDHGANVIIYANQLIRSAFPAMQKAAKTILENSRAKEVDDFCMNIKEIITLIPER